MRKILNGIAMLLLCILLIGCSNTNNANNTKNTKEFSVDEKELEDNGYEKLADIAYGKIEDNGDKPKVYLVYRQQEPELAFYLMNTIMQKFELKCDFTITWNGEEYIFDDETANDFTEETFSDAFPKDWHEVIKDVQSGIKINDFVTKSSADIIDDTVEKFVSEYLEKDQQDIILSKEYEFENGTISMSLSKDDKKEYHFAIGIKSDIEWKAACAYIIYSELINTEEMQSLNPTIIMTCKNVIITSAMSWEKNEKGEMEIIDGAEWATNTFSNGVYTDEELKTFSKDLQDFIVDFVSEQ